MLKFKILLILFVSLILQGCQTTEPIRIDRRGRAIASNDNYDDLYNNKEQYLKTNDKNIEKDYPTLFSEHDMRR